MIKNFRADPKMRWWDTLAVLLVMICLFVATLRLMTTHWTENLAVVQTVAFFGVVLGLALGQSIFSTRVAMFFTLAYGVFIIPWQLGITLEEGVVDWVEKLVNMRGRLEIIVNALLKRETIYDNLLFIVAMTCLFWLLSIHAGFSLTRTGNPWLTVLPTGVSIFVIHTFDSLLVRRTWYLAFYLFFALLLIARLVYLRKRQFWKQTRIHTPADVGFDFSRIALIATIIVVLFAWNMPVLAESLSPVSSAWARVTRPWRSFKDSFGFAFASLRSSVGIVTNMYGENMMLGKGAPLGDNIIIMVDVPAMDMKGAKFYWRGRIYDTYKNGEWGNTFSQKITLTPDNPNLIIGDSDLRQETELTVTAYDSVALLYVASQPIWVNRVATASVTNNLDGTVDLGSLISNDYIRPGEHYTTRSSLPAMTIKDLRESGTDYPQWVVDKYLQLPETITPRTYELAQRLAEGKETPYDIAQTITDYLRRNIKYTPTVPNAPSGTERIDWFLFDLGEGYCNYYASAEVILLRSLGIPARLAVGFAQGEAVLPEDASQVPDAEENSDKSLDGRAGTYIVRHRDAHAWPEVYFPGIGWVEFEPTSSQAAIARPSGEDVSATAPNEQQNRRDYLMEPLDDSTLMQGLDTPVENSQQEEFWTPKTLVLMVISLALIILVGLGVWHFRRGFRLAPHIERFVSNIPVSLEKSFKRLGIRPPQFLSKWAQYVQLPSLSRSYLQVNDALNRLGQPPELNETPAERVNQLSIALPPTQPHAQKLLAEYQAGIYSQHHFDEFAAHRAGKEIRRLSYREMLGRWLARIRRPFG